jgi:hypothetical protein
MKIKLLKCLYIEETNEREFPSLEIETDDTGYLLPQYYNQLEGWKDVIRLRFNYEDGKYCLKGKNK